MNHELDFALHAMASCTTTSSPPPVEIAIITIKMRAINHTNCAWVLVLRSYQPTSYLPSGRNRHQPPGRRLHCVDSRTTHERVVEETAGHYSLAGERMLATSPPERHLHLCCRLLLHIGQHVAVDVKGDPDLGMAQHLAHDLGVDTSA